LGELHIIADKIDDLGDLSACPHWKKRESDTAKIREATLIGSRLRHENASINHDIESVSNSRGTLLNLVEDGNEMLAEDASIGSVLFNSTEALRKFQQIQLDFLNHVKGEDLYLATNLEEESLNHLDAIERACDSIVSRQKELKLWCDWRRVRDEAQDLTIESMADALETGLIDSDIVLEAFEANYCRWWSLCSSIKTKF